MAWIRLEDTFTDHPKFRKLSRRLSIRPVYARGHVATLWAWVVRHAPDGSLVSRDNEDIALAADWDGDPDAFVAALETVGLLDKTEDGYQIHNWMDRAESYKRANQKAKERSAKKVARQSHDSLTTVPDCLIREDREDRDDPEDQIETTDRQTRSRGSETTEIVPDADAPGRLDASASLSPMAQARAACLERGWQWTTKARSAFEALGEFTEDELSRALVKASKQGDLTGSRGGPYLAGVIRHQREDDSIAEEKSRGSPINGTRRENLDECTSAGDILASLFKPEEQTA